MGTSCLSPHWGPRYTLAASLDLCDHMRARCQPRYSSRPPKLCAQLQRTRTLPPLASTTAPMRQREREATGEDTSIWGPHRPGSGPFLSRWPAPPPLPITSIFSYAPSCSQRKPHHQPPLRCACPGREHVASHRRACQQTEPSNPPRSSQLALTLLVLTPTTMCVSATGHC